jgi:hypothetical protein
MVHHRFFQAYLGEPPASLREGGRRAASHHGATRSSPRALRAAGASASIALAVAPTRTMVRLCDSLRALYAKNIGQNSQSLSRYKLSV